MITYKNWKQLYESVGHTTTLGLRKPTTIGELQNRWNEMGMMPPKKKPPFGGGDDMGDEGGPMMMPPKKKKKGLPPPPPDDDALGDEELGDEELGDEDDIEGDEDAIGDDEDDIEGDEGDLEGDEDALSGDEEGLEGDEDDLDDDEALDGGDDMGDMPPPPPAPPGGGGSKKDKHLMKGAHHMMKGASHVMKGMQQEGAHEEGCACPACEKCKMSAKKSRKMAKKMQKEEADFIASLKSQCQGQTHWDLNSNGTFKEDALFTPYDPNAGLEDENEPGPGEVGHAPQQRMGGELGSMAEWTKKYRRKINEAICTEGKKSSKKRRSRRSK